MSNCLLTDADLRYAS